MKTVIFFRVLIWLLIVATALPPPVFAQEERTRTFSEAELDQMLAPIALYPDSLLAQIFIAATYPLEVVMADRWIRENQNLTVEARNDALDDQPWDASVKALVPFPEVLTMMSQRLDWTQSLGDAFLSQQNEVMDTVQRLRRKANEARNLESNDQQNVIVEQEVIRIEPATPTVVYVPVYDPWWVYGPWWWPAYPPYVVYPYYPRVVIAPGFVWFGFGVVVGGYWGRAWGHWDWHRRACFVNVNRTVNINRTNINIARIQTAPWKHDPSHRRGVAYRDRVTRERFGQTNRQAVENRRSFRGFETDRTGRPARPDAPGRPPGTRGARPEMRTERPAAPGAAVRPPDTRAVRPEVRTQRPAAPGPTGRPPDMAVTRPGPPPQAPGRAVQRPEAGQPRPGFALEGIGRGDEVRRQSDWGRESLRSAQPPARPQGEAIRSQPQPGRAPSSTPGQIRSTPGGAPRGGRR